MVKQTLLYSFQWESANFCISRSLVSITFNLNVIIIIVTLHLYGTESLGRKKTSVNMKDNQTSPLPSRETEYIIFSQLFFFLLLTHSSRHQQDILPGGYFDFLGGTDLEKCTRGG